MSREREVPGREPWAITFGVFQTYAACVVAAALFSAFLWLWLRWVVPDGVLESEGSAARISLVFGTAATVLLVLLGPPVAWVVGNLLRRSASTAVHVIAFTFAGSVVGGLLGAVLGPDVAVTLAATLGAATGLTRLAFAPYGRRLHDAGAGSGAGPRR